MKRFTIHMTLAVAALTVAAGTISAETLKAEIPFAFRVGNQVMQPGEYRVSVSYALSGSQTVSFTAVDARRTVFAMPLSSDSAPREWRAAGLPKLSFQCGEGPCTITRMWMGEGNALDFPSFHRKYGDVRISEIVLRPDRAN